MKESITKFDLEAAFKALDEIDTPVAEKGIKANKPALTEIFSRKSKFDTLFEEYYDINNTQELSDAKEARDAEVAKAKLARIEKIVDLDAESPDDLLMSYVGKFIIQCPQCMTLFYKNPEDVEESEEDANTVNVNEVCQHCGNESGYTLIGKVGEATAEETTAEEDEISLAGAEELHDEENSEEFEESEEASVEDALDDFDLDGELEELDLEIEDDEKNEEEKKEESFSNETESNVLVEQLIEEAELDISESEFEELINSPEFKKPISDKAVRVMMGAEEENTQIKKENTEESFKEPKTDNQSLEESPEKKAEYKLIFEPTNDAKDADLTTDLCDLVSEVQVKYHSAKKLAGKYYITVLGTEEDLEAAKTAIENSGFFKAWLKKDKLTTNFSNEDTSGENLEEGIFDKLKNKLVNKIDKITGTLKSREAKADWVRKTALENYNEVRVDNEGGFSPEENKSNQRFHTFVVIGFKDRYSNGKLITTAPSFNNKDLVIGENGVQLQKNYKNADKIAQGWSQLQGNGPAFIYLAKNEKDTKAVFLCEYFDGKLEYDQLDRYFEIVKKNLKACKLMNTGGMKHNEPEEQPSEAALNIKEIKASEAKKGMKIKISTEIGEIIEIAKSKLKAGYLAITLKLSEDELEILNVEPDAKLSLVVSSADKAEESLTTIMQGIDELNEAVLEDLITNSLIEAYQNVAGFRLTECTCNLNDNFKVTGNIYFTSGRTRHTTYTFTEAYTKDDKIFFSGLNEKLGTDKQFTLIGFTDKSNNTLITESFKCSKR